MKLALRDVAFCISGELPIVIKKRTKISDELLEKNILLDVLSEGDWEELVITTGTIDSRIPARDSLFFCIAGERSNGHDFAAEAVSNGAVAVVAEIDPFLQTRLEGKKGLPPVLLVENVERALWKLALFQRSLTKAVVIGITGSAGKTTLKEVLSGVLALSGKTERNHKNFNTQIGLPLSMVNADTAAVYWVLEAGVSQSHDMEELGSIMQPDVAVVLNAGVAHSEGLGEKGVAHHKVELFGYLTDNGQAFANADYPEIVKEVDLIRPLLNADNALVRFFSGRNHEAFCSSQYVVISNSGLGQYSVRILGCEFTCEAPFIGAYGAENVSAVVAVASSLGLTQKEIITGLREAKLPEQRFTRKEFGSVTVIDDSYNANPISMNGMLEATSLLAKSLGKKVVLVIGMMGELGAEEAAIHEQLGQTIAKTHSSVLFWKGGFSAEVQKGLASGGYTGTFITVADPESFCADVHISQIENAVILFKGSRSNRLEEYVAAFTSKISQ